jgi:hypothetical protein
LIATTQHSLPHEITRRLLTNVFQDEETRANKQSELDKFAQEINVELARSADDGESLALADYVSSEIDQLKKYINRKETETERIINSSTKFIRAIGAADQTPQNTQNASDTPGEESSDSKGEEEQAADVDDTEMMDV